MPYGIENVILVQSMKPIHRQAARYIISMLKEGYSVEHAKRLAGKRFALSSVLRNSDILAACTNDEKKMFNGILRKRKTRTLSGVTPVAVMTMSDCPHGRCIYCPRGHDAAQSYTGKEPAALRAIQNHFDSYSQVRARLNQYKEIGHPTDKCELIIMGGTFLAQSKEYKNAFVKGCYEGFNNTPASDIETAKTLNETAKHRVIGLTIETRPDWCFERHIDEMLLYGATRVELGVQTLDNSIYSKVKRGHTVEDVICATRLLKDSGFKVCYHMMPGLFSTPEQDIGFFQNLFDDERFRPDMLKIYPTLVIKGTELYDLWKEDKFEPYDTETAADVISEMYRYIPGYVRVMRVQRDIPLHQITFGITQSNLREIVEKRCEEKGIQIREIRHREVGMRSYKNKQHGSAKKTCVGSRQIRLIRKEYKASRGTEVFLSHEDSEDSSIFGFLRLRRPFKPFREEITGSTAIVRELHVYGEEIRIGGKASNTRAVQHKGYGKELLKEAERIANDEWGMEYMIIISGPGAREYYRRLGYAPKGPYMWKKLC